MSDVQVKVMAELVTMLRGVIETAVCESPEAAVDMVGEYFEEAGVDDSETRKILDLWWASRPIYTRMREQERRRAD